MFGMGLMFWGCMNMSLRRLQMAQGTSVRGVTDDRGELRFSAVRGGPATVRVRRLGFQPTTLVPPNAPHQNKCTSQQTSDYAQCQAAKNTSLCKQFADGQSGQACRQCIETQASDQRWGVIVFQGTTSGTINVEGCVDDALGQTSKEKENGGTGSCGDLLHASYGCQDQACAACSGDDAQSCIDDAVSGGCKSYDQAVQSGTGPCSALLGDAAPAAASACFPDDTISDPTQRDVDWLTRIVGYMCGP